MKTWIFFLIASLLIISLLILLNLGVIPIFEKTIEIVDIPQVIIIK